MVYCGDYGAAVGDGEGAGLVKGRGVSGAVLVIGEEGSETYGWTEVFLDVYYN